MNNGRGRVNASAILAAAVAAIITAALIISPFIMIAMGVI